ncbi:hypothetical protein Hanom_Chr01g00092481 [Helianthus anomalus]
MDVVGFRKRNFFNVLCSVSFLFFRKCNFFLFSVSYLCCLIFFFMLFDVVFSKFYKLFITLGYKIKTKEIIK